MNANQFTKATLDRIKRGSFESPREDIGSNLLETHSDDNARGKKSDCAGQT